MNELIKVLEFPSSALLAVVFLLISFAIEHYGHGNRLVKVMGSSKSAIVMLAIGAAMLAVEGTWAVPVHSSIVFAVYLAVLLLCLAFAILGGFRRKAKAGFLLNHLGMFIIVWASLFGAPDVSKSKMIVGYNHPMDASLTNDGYMVPLPFNVALKDFHIDYYPDGKSPRQFTSTLLIDGQQMSTSVNSPLSYNGYTIYQDGYDREYGQYTVLQFVRNPWLPIVYLGMILLAAGSVMLLFGRWKAKAAIPAVIVLTIAFTAFSISKINFGTMMPALRSWWFVPHVFIYMVAYSLMAMALVMMVIRFMREDNKERVESKLVRSSSALLVIGMLTGSVWAWQAWGDYWAWDPKENWAAATWFIALIYLHMHGKRGWKALSVIVIAFMALQITWYGVNYLPSAINSMHTYMSN